MRGIKFRGLGRDDHKFYYGSVAHNCNNFPILLIPKQDGTMDRIFIHPETLGQYTGRKDKNSTEIYAGDVANVIFEDGVILCVVKWSDYWPALECKPIDEQKYGTQDFFHSGRGMPLEVIGNIHENPELLEVS